jgi:hypothetical protein
MGSSVYLILLVIYLPPFSPVPCPDDPDTPLPFGKAYGHDATFDLTKTKEPIFVCAMAQIFNNHAMGIGKGVLGIKKRNVMLLLVLLVFHIVPLKAWSHMPNVIQTGGAVKEFFKGRRDISLEIWALMFLEEGGREHLE